MTKWQPEVTRDCLILVRWHTKPYMNNNDNIGWLFFGGYKNILPSMLTILPSSSTQATLLTSLAIYSCIPHKAIQYYINIDFIIIIVINISKVDFRIKSLVWIILLNFITCLQLSYVCVYNRNTLTFILWTYSRNHNTIVYLQVQLDFMYNRPNSYS